MEVLRFKLRGKKEIELSCFKIIPEEVKGVIHILHGMGEHKERYLHFAKYLAKNSYAVYAHDHRKHGDSVKDESEVGIFTKADKWDDIIDDCNFVSRQIKKDFPNVPIIILGHSMGSLIARKFISKYPNSSKLAIIMGTTPPITLGRAFIPLAISSILSLFNKKLKRSEFLAKQLNEPLIAPFEPRRTDFDWISADEGVVDKYIKDPLCGYSYTPRFYKEFFKGILDVNKYHSDEANLRGTFCSRFSEFPLDAWNDPHSDDFCALLMTLNEDCDLHPNTGILPFYADDQIREWILKETEGLTGKIIYLIKWAARYIIRDELPELITMKALKIALKKIQSTGW